MNQENKEVGKKEILQRLFISGHISWEEMYILMRPDYEIVVKNKKDAEIVPYYSPPHTINTNTVNHTL